MRKTGFSRPCCRSSSSSLIGECGVGRFLFKYLSSKALESSVCALEWPLNGFGPSGLFGRASSLAKFPLYCARPALMAIELWTHLKKGEV